MRIEPRARAGAHAASAATRRTDPADASLAISAGARSGTAEPPH